MRTRYESTRFGVHENVICWFFWGLFCGLSRKVKFRYNRSHEYSGVFDVLRRTVKSEGVFALWKGVSAQYSRIVPHTILTILFAEALGFDFDP